jgi:hypothetical protein
LFPEWQADIATRDVLPGFPIIEGFILGGRSELGAGFLAARSLAQSRLAAWEIEYAFPGLDVVATRALRVEFRSHPARISRVFWHRLIG